MYAFFSSDRPTRSSSTHSFQLPPHAPLHPPPPNISAPPLDSNRPTMMRGGGGGAEDYYGGPRGAPHGLLMAVVLGLVVAGPLFMGDGGEAITGAVADLLGPTGLLLLPVTLILLIRVLSSNRGAAVLAFGGSPDSVHRVGGSPVGVALALLLIVVLLYYRTSLFGAGGDDDE